MELITETQKRELLANSAKQIEMTERAETEELEEVFDPVPVVKLFSPENDSVWLVTEIDADDNSMAFGLADLGVGSPEFGQFNIPPVPTGQMKIERDESFIADKPISVYASIARENGKIIA